MVTAEYFDQASSGIGTHVYYLSRELARRGHDLHLVTSVQRPPAIPPAPGMRLHLIPFFQGFLLRNVLWTAAARAAVSRLPFRPDVVHAHVPLCQAYPLVHRASVPLVSTFHTLFYNFRDVPQKDWRFVLHSRVGEMSDSVALAASDAVVACSESIRDEIVHLGFPRERVTLAPNGVPWEDYGIRPSDKEMEDLRRRYPLPKAKRVVLVVGDLVRRKGVDILLDAIRELDRKAPGTYGLVAVGAGPDRARLEGLCRGIEGLVTFTGRVSLEDLRRLYYAADLFAMPSYYEGLPTVVLEALSSGLPVIGADIPSMHGLLDRCGLLVERSPTAFADGIHRLLEDEAGLRRMRAAAREAAHPFSWSRLAADVERAYLGTAA